MRASGAQGSRAFRKSARPARGHWRRAGGAGPGCAQLLRRRPRLTRQVQRPPDGRGHDLLNPAPGARECSWTHAHEDVQIGRKASGHEPSQPKSENCWSQTPSIVVPRCVRCLLPPSTNTTSLSLSFPGQNRVPGADLSRRWLGRTACASRDAASCGLPTRTRSPEFGKQEQHRDSGAVN